MVFLNLNITFHLLNKHCFFQDGHAVMNRLFLTYEFKIMDFLCKRF